MTLLRKTWDRFAIKAVEALVASFSTTAEAAFYRKYPRLMALLGGGVSTKTGKAISEATALNCSVVWTCVRVIADAVAALPVVLYERIGEADRRAARTHPLFGLLRRRANPRMTAMRFRHTLQTDLLLWGNAYARIQRAAGEPDRVLALWPIEPQNVTKIEAPAGGELIYHVARQTAKTSGFTTEPIPQREMLHLRGLGLDGVVGLSVVSAARESIALGLTTEEYVAKFFAQGGRKPYYLHKPSNFKTDEEFRLFRERWEAAYSAAGDSFHKAVVIEGDLELKELGMSLEDAQFLGTRNFTVGDICRWFRVSPHLAGDLERATFSNIEHLDLEFLKYTLGYWLTNWEEEIFSQLLTQEEQDQERFFPRFNVNALLRGDYQSRTEGYARLLQNGVVSINEVRAWEELNAIQGGGAHHIQLNMQTIPGTGDPTPIEAATAARNAAKPGAGAPQQGG